MLLGEACDKPDARPAFIVIRVCGSIIRIRYMHRAANELHAAHVQGERAPTRPGSGAGLLIRIGTVLLRQERYETRCSAQAPAYAFLLWGMWPGAAIWGLAPF